MVNAMELLNNWRNADQLNALRAQQMDREAQMQPYQIEAAKLNMLAKRQAMMQDEARRNALQQYGATGNINALAMGDPETAAKIRMNQQATDSRERMMQQRFNMMQNRPRQPIPWQTKETENGLIQINPMTGEVRPVMGSDGLQVTGKKNEKALPTSAAQKLMENQQNLRRAEQAEALVEGKNVTDPQGNVIAQGDKEATGKKALLSAFGVLGDKALNWLDEKGVDTRAAIGDLGSLIIHDRSGAAVTASEYPRLRPFIPLATDAPEVARRKAQRFANEYRNIQQEMADFYKESGYKVPTETLRGSGVNKGAISGVDAQALEWARANPNDPRSAQIKSRLGVQ